MSENIRGIHNPFQGFESNKEKKACNNLRTNLTENVSEQHQTDVFTNAAIITIFLLLADPNLDATSKGLAIALLLFMLDKQKAVRRNFVIPCTNHTHLIMITDRNVVTIQQEKNDIKQEEEADKEEINPNDCDPGGQNGNVVIKENNNDVILTEYNDDEDLESDLNNNCTADLNNNILQRDGVTKENTVFYPDVCRENQLIFQLRQVLSENWKDFALLFNVPLHEIDNIDEECNSKVKPCVIEMMKKIKAYSGLRGSALCSRAYETLNNRMKRRDLATQIQQLIS